MVCSLNISQQWGKYCRDPIVLNGVLIDYLTAVGKYCPGNCGHEESIVWLGRIKIETHVTELTATYQLRLFSMFSLHFLIFYLCGQ